MGSPKEHARLFGKKVDNKEPTIASISAVEFVFNESGTDTATAYYYDLGSGGAYHVSIRPSATVLITKVNGVTLSNPITVSTAGYFDKQIEWHTCTIETTAINTILRVLAKGGY